MSMKNKVKYKIWWDEQYKIVRPRAIGVLDVHEARGILETTEKMAVDHGTEIDWLIDLSQMTKATSRARKILAEASSHPSIQKYAFVSASIFIRTVANFISATVRQKNARHFAEEKDALKWIRENS